MALELIYPESPDKWLKRAPLSQGALARMAHLNPLIKAINELIVAVSALNDSTTGITAFASGGQSGATQLNPGFNEVNTAASAGASVRLPGATETGIVTVKNNGANRINIFPASGDTINTLSANSSISLVPGASVTLRSVNPPAGSRMTR